MRTTEAYADLLRVRRPIMTTGEVASRLRVPEYSASRLLRTLARDGIALKVRRGLWSLTDRPDPYTLPPALTAPYPSYVSVWTALYRHGMIDQIPPEIYVVSLDRSKRIKTPVGTFVVQHLAPNLFGGFEIKDHVQVATPEKALFDTLYLALSRGRRFASLPEIDLPADFDEAKTHHWAHRIRSHRLRTLVQQRLAAALARAERE